MTQHKELVERLRELYEKAGWAKDWTHDIVPPGKPAHELDCLAIRLIPHFLALSTSRKETLEEAAKVLDRRAAEIRETPGLRLARIEAEANAAAIRSLSTPATGEGE